MNILFETPEKLNGLITLTFEKDDYQPEVDKKLKDYRKKANVPGFRPGQVPMGMIKRQYGTSVKVDVINKLLGEKLYDYVRTNKIEMLGDPLPSNKQGEVNFEGDDALTFVFDIALAPEFKAELTADDTVDYYTIDVDDKIIDQQLDAYLSRTGHYDKVEDYDPAQNDMLKGDIRELDADGNVKEDGITVEAAVMMPEYIKVEDQKKLFDGAKVGALVKFNPKKAYPEGDAEISSLLKIQKDEVANLNSDFSYLVTEVSRFVKGEINQKFFDEIFGEGNVKSEQECREKIADTVKVQLTSDQDYKFLLDVRAFLEQKVGKLEFPDALLKRIMLNNNKEKGEQFVNENYDKSIQELEWHLIKEQLVNAYSIKVDENDLKEIAKEAARAQFAQYGMDNVPEEYLDNYATEMMKKRENVDSLVSRAVDVKLIDALKKVVKMNGKTISLEDFQKMMQAK